MRIRAAVSALTAALLACAALAQGAAKAGPPAAPPAVPSIAVVDLLRVFYESNSGKIIRDTMDEERARRSKELRSMEVDLMSLEERIRGSAQRGLSPEKVEELKSQYEASAKSYETRLRSADKEMEDLHNSKMKELEDRVTPIILDIQKEKRLDLIFDRPQSGIIYLHSALDITPEVLTRFKAVEAAAGIVAPAPKSDAKAPASGAAKPADSKSAPPKK
jgi:Skp family chaperone for outer membrane proteins